MSCPDNKTSIILLLFATLFLSGSFVSANSIRGQAVVIDGDTFEIQGKRVRLHGIDAPESNQICKDKNEQNYRCGSAATQRLTELIGWRAVTCEIRDTDRYGRWVAICSINKQDINRLLVREGLALAYRKYSRAYLQVEKEARKSRAGLWQGKFIKPWDWRQGKRLEADNAEVSGRCLIKGNISNSGKIYHMPGSKWYNKTKINESKGERWFCSEAEAKAAGWRAPKG